MKTYRKGNKTYPKLTAMDNTKEARNLWRIDVAIVAFVEEHDPEPLIEMFKAGFALHKHEAAKDLIVDLLRKKPVRGAGQAGKKKTFARKIRELNAVIHYCDLIKGDPENKREPLGEDAAALKAAELVEENMTLENFKNILKKYSDHDCVKELQK